MQSVRVGSTSILRSDFARRLEMFAVAAIAAMIFIVFAPKVLSDYTVSVTTVILLTIPGAIALNIVFGLCGQVSAGNSAFLAVGAFSAAGITKAHPDANILIVLAGAAVIGAVGGAIVAVPAVRVRGLLLLISTLSFHFIITYTVQRYQTESVGQAGFLLPRFEILGWQALATEDWFRVFGVFAFLCTVLMSVLAHSALGRAWSSIRENEVAAQVLGVRIVKAKVIAFVISSTVIAVQGALFAYFLRTLQYELFTLDLAIQYIAIVIIGGLGSVGGTLAGATIVVSLPYVLRSVSENVEGSSSSGGFISKHIFELQSFSYGALIVGFLLFRPDGLDGLLRSAAAQLRRVRTRVLKVRSR